MTIIVDSDGLIGSLNPQDQHFSTAQKILHKLVEAEAKFIYPATTIAETVTFLQGRLNAKDLANKVIDMVNNNELNIETVDSMLVQKASVLMDFNKSKHHTLFDAIVAAVAEKYNADAIFSFDKFYQKKGFKLTSELI